MTDTHKYDDIIGMEHHSSPRHQRMSMADRAAQFAPFAALTGYDTMVEETVRITESIQERKGRQEEDGEW